MDSKTKLIIFAEHNTPANWNLTCVSFHAGLVPSRQQASTQIIDEHQSELCMHVSQDL